VCVRVCVCVLTPGPYKVQVLKNGAGDGNRWVFEVKRALR
jgi:hypothetical protein